VPQARAGLLPNVALSASANANYFGTNLDSNPHVGINRNFGLGGLTVSASQPLYRYANSVAYSQAVEQVQQADYTLASARQDLILRVAGAYFDVLLAQFTVEVTESQKAAVSEQLAQAKRNFEVGVATITDTNEAQAKYDSIVAQEISAQNDLENKRTALRAIIGRAPPDLKKLGPGFDPVLPSPNALDVWVERALADNLAVRVAQYNADIAALEIERQRAGRLPTVDLVASFNTQAFNATVNTSSAGEQHQAAIGVALNVPLYTGGFVDSKVREALALQDAARQNLEVARRNALFSAQTGFTGVTSAAASVKAFEQALVSAQTAYESNKTGQEVGVRTNLDVLNTQQNVFQTRRDLAQAYFNYLLGVLRLKFAVGSLDETDLEEINRRLRG
jgi:outer membrane protein